MRIFKENLENMTGRRGLYRVWAPAREGEATLLVARWIDPQAETHREGSSANHAFSEVVRIDDSVDPRLAKNASPGTKDAYSFGLPVKGPKQVRTLL